MIVNASNQKVEIRDGILEDIPLLLSFIQKMADFEKLPITATKQSLRESLFGETPAARFFFVYVQGNPIAYVTYYFTFSSMMGKRGLWLDDLFIVPEYRSQGIGQIMMAYIADLAEKNNCGRFEWTVLDWNENAIRFYKKLGAEIMDSWRLCRLQGEQITPLAANFDKYRQDH